MHVRQDKFKDSLEYFSNLLEKTLIPLLDDYVKHKESAQVFYFVASFLETHDDFSELLNRAPVALIQDFMEKSNAFYCYLVLLAKLLEEKENVIKSSLSLDERRFFKDKDCDVNFTKINKTLNLRRNPCGRRQGTTGLPVGE